MAEKHEFVYFIISSSNGDYSSICSIATAILPTSNTFCAWAAAAPFFVGVAAAPELNPLPAAVVVFDPAVPAATPVAVAPAVPVALPVFDIVTSPTPPSVGAAAAFASKGAGVIVVVTAGKSLSV